MENDRFDAFQGNGEGPPLEWARIKHLRAVVPQHVIFRPFSSEMVLLNIETGLYHGMDEVGSRCFEALRASDTLEAALEALTKEYEGPQGRIRGDLVGYCSELLAHGLIELRGSST
jgi:hypothetical protein